MKVPGYVRIGTITAAFAFALGCRSNVVSTDGNTSWVATCADDGDCGGELSCLCGVCTTTCESDRTCGASGRCVRSSSMAFGAACGADSTIAGVCLQSCPASGCGKGRACVDGTCIAQAVTRPSMTDSGAPSGGAPAMDAAVVRGSGGASSGASGMTTGGAPTVPPPFDGGAPGTAGTTGGSLVPDSGTMLADCTHFDAATVAGRPPVSFTNDILPIFGLSCVAADCHGADASKAGLYLGNKCAYDGNAKWKCTFPTVAQGDPSLPAPDDAQTKAVIYTNLLAPASTVNSGTVRRVVRDDPENSFLVLSLANQQNSRGYACTNQDPSHESPAPPCGVSMPQNGDLWCNSASVQAKFDAVVTWIAQGAPFN